MLSAGASLQHAGVPVQLRGGSPRALRDCVAGGGAVPGRRGAEDRGGGGKQGGGQGGGAGAAGAHHPRLPDGQYSTVQYSTVQLTTLVYLMVSSGLMVVVMTVMC